MCTMEKEPLNTTEYVCYKVIYVADPDLPKQHATYLSLATGVKYTYPKGPIIPVTDQNKQPANYFKDNLLTGNFFNHRFTGKTAGFVHKRNAFQLRGSGLRNEHVKVFRIKLTGELFQGTYEEYQDVIIGSHMEILEEVLE